MQNSVQMTVLFQISFLHILFCKVVLFSCFLAYFARTTEQDRAPMVSCSRGEFLGVAHSKFAISPSTQRSPVIKVNVRLQFVSHHQFMAQFCDCPIKFVLNISFGSIRCFSILFLITNLWPSSNDTILSHISIFHHFVLIYDETKETI